MMGQILFFNLEISTTEKTTPIGGKESLITSLNHSRLVKKPLAHFQL
jgi:hypothetical protein